MNEMEVVSVPLFRSRGRPVIMKSHTEYLTPRSLFGEPGSSRSEELAQRRLEDAERIAKSRTVKRRRM